MTKLIILGAGSSVDFGFPTGLKLLESIHSLWNKPNEEYVMFYLEALNKHGKKFSDFDNVAQAAVKKIQQLSHRLFYSSADSIDDFLSQPHEEYDIDFGKLTILNLILEKEKLAIQSNNQEGLYKWQENWLRIFFGREFRFKRIEGLIEKLEQNPIKFITFNYDRSLENFIFNSIKSYYALDIPKTKEIFSKIFFRHVYGNLAPLEWQLDSSSDVLHFGEDFKGYPMNKMRKLYRCVSNIQTINQDRTDLEGIKQDFKRLLSEASKVYFLGFGFHESNFGLLGIDEYKKDRKNGIESNKFYYTTYGLSDGQKDVIKNRFGVSSLGAEVTVSSSRSIYEYMRHDY